MINWPGSFDENNQNVAENSKRTVDTTSSITARSTIFQVKEIPKTIKSATL
jgi:hypothetical protein